MSNEAIEEPRFNWPQILVDLINQRDLSVEQASWAMEEMMSGASTDAQIAGFLMSLTTKGETVDELLGLADAMLDESVPFEAPDNVLDIVGTGGDRLDTVNLSTMSSLVAVGAGAKIVKHGNRGASSSAGAADVIEALGVDLRMSQELAYRCLEEAGVTFLFAQEYHPSMRFVAPARKQLGVPTAFNFLGPLSNPARVKSQALGCASERMAPLMAGVLADRGVRGLVFRGSDGRDKITTSGPSRVWEVRDGGVTVQDIHPEEFGIPVAAVEDLKGKDPIYNAQIIRDLLAGEKGPVRDAVLLNAAAGLVSYDTDASGDLVDRLKANIDKAAESIDSGAAQGVLDNWIKVANNAS